MDNNISMTMCTPVITPPDYTNYSRDRRRMSTDNEVMRQFQKDLAAVPSLSQVKSMPTEFGSESTTVNCPHCKMEVKTKITTNGLIRFCPGCRQRVTHNCPSCGALLGTNSDSF